MEGRHEHAFNDLVTGIVNTPDVTDEDVANAYLKKPLMNIERLERRSCTYD